MTLPSEARQAERLALAGRLAAGVAHDFNNILAAMMGAAEAIAARPGVDGETRADAAQLATAARRGAALARHLLAFVRDTPPAPCRLDVRAALEDLSGLVRHIAGRAVCVTVEVAEATGGPLEVEIDPTGFDQVLLNLAANARDAMPGGGTLRIACAGRGEEAVVEVRDSGCGIPPAVLPRIFEPFFTAGKPDGTGLGLATVAEVVQGAGGRVEVESAPGAGTCMRVCLPRLSPRAGVAAGSGTVLLVEDEPLTRRLATRMLSAAGWSVRVAGSLAEALAAAQDVALTAVVADHELPDGDGAALVAALRRGGTPGLPAVIASGHGPAALRREPAIAALLAAAPGAAAVLAKPYKAAELCAALAGVTGRSDPAA